MANTCCGDTCGISSALYITLGSDIGPGPIELKGYRYTK